jgi:hypothetical protein
MIHSSSVIRDRHPEPYPDSSHAVGYQKTLKKFQHDADTREVLSFGYGL